MVCTPPLPNITNESIHQNEIIKIQLSPTNIDNHFQHLFLYFHQHANTIHYNIRIIQFNQDLNQFIIYRIKIDETEELISFKTRLKEQLKHKLFNANDPDYDLIK